MLVRPWGRGVVEVLAVFFGVVEIQRREGWSRTDRQTDGKKVGEILTVVSTEKLKFGVSPVMIKGCFFIILILWLSWVHS